MGGRVRGVSLACALTSRHPKPFPISFATQTGARRFRTPSKGEGGGRHRWASRHVGDIPLLQATALRTAHPVPCVQRATRMRQQQQQLAGWHLGRQVRLCIRLLLCLLSLPPLSSPAKAATHTRARRRRAQRGRACRMAGPGSTGAWGAEAHLVTCGLAVLPAAPLSEAGARTNAAPSATSHAAVSASASRLAPMLLCVLSLSSCG